MAVTESRKIINAKTSKSKPISKFSSKIIINSNSHNYIITNNHKIFNNINNLWKFYFYIIIIFNYILLLLRDLFSSIKFILYKKTNLINIVKIFGFHSILKNNSVILKATITSAVLLNAFGLVDCASASHSYHEISSGNYISSNHVITTSQQEQIQQQSLNSGCPQTADPNCQRCNIEGCIKCRILLIEDTRICSDVCPSGYLEQWSSSPDYMGRICVSQGLSPPLLAAITGLIVGTLVCFVIVILAIFFMKRKRRRTSIKNKLINENTIDRDEFLRQIEEMRPNAEYFLAMLNDSRRQIRKLYLSGDPATANSYRPIIRDLAKILILLNRPIELIPDPPPDWLRIYNWSEQALERYKPRVGQLIDFLQSPQDDSNQLIDYNYQLNGNNHLTLNNGDPRRSFHSLQQQQKFQLFGSLISLHDFDEPFGNNSNNFNTLKGNLISDLNASSLWLEDEFFKLGFRPQDEITTEL